MYLLLTCAHYRRHGFPGTNTTNNPYSWNTKVSTNNTPTCLPANAHPGVAPRRRHYQSVRQQNQRATRNRIAKVRIGCFSGRVPFPASVLEYVCEWCALSTAPTADRCIWTRHPSHHQANLLYIDQPAGTGFSYGTWRLAALSWSQRLNVLDFMLTHRVFMLTLLRFAIQPIGVAGVCHYIQSKGTGMDHDEAGVAKDMYAFLQGFFKEYSQYAGLDFYAFGESYAGAYRTSVPQYTFLNHRATNAKTSRASPV